MVLTGSERVRSEMNLKGTALSRGIAFGPLFFFTSPDEDEIEEKKITLKEVKGELKRFNQALKRSRDDLIRLKNELERENFQEGAAILDAHIHMIQDPVLIASTEEEIRALKSADFAFKLVIQGFMTKFEALDDPFFQERAKDLADVARRITSHLRESKYNQWEEVLEPSIIVSKDLSASSVAECNPKNVLAFITETGSLTSHAAIIARAKGIPYLSGIGYQLLADIRHAQAIVDARAGHLIVHPSHNLLLDYKKMKERMEMQLHILRTSAALKSETMDGYEVKLSANIDVDSELEMLHQYGGHGVGLFRSEYVFLTHDTFPNEEEQYAIYKRIVEKMQGLPIVIRTFDVGGDKGNFPLQNREDNPYLGCRAIRFLLKERKIFITQLRAILRAAMWGQVSLMFPMVSGLSELTEAKAILAQVEKDLEQEGISHKKNIPIGSMIEVPSAAIISDLLARECQFLSIGTNDLVQYSLAVDRGNQNVSGFYTPSHPGILRLIKMVVSEANRHGIPVTVCGEIAADPKFTPLLLGLGVHELSVAARHIPIVKNRVRSLSIVRAYELAEIALTLHDSADIQALLEAEYQKTVPADHLL